MTKKDKKKKKIQDKLLHHPILKVFIMTNKYYYKNINKFYFGKRRK